MKVLIAAAILAIAFVRPASAGPLLLDAEHVGEGVLAVGGDGAMLWRSGAGQRWQRLPSVVPTTLTGLHVGEDGAVWAVGHAGVVLQSVDGGRNWARSALPSGDEPHLLDVLVVSDQHVIAVGGAGAYRATHDGGESWQREELDFGMVNFNRITRAGEHLYIAGDDGCLLRSPDLGRSWEREPTGTTAALYSVIQLADGSLLAHGLHGTVLRADAPGQPWTAISTPFRVALFSSLELPDRTIIVAGQGQVCWLSRDGGRSFQPVRHRIPAIAKLLLDGNALLTFGDGGVHALDLPSAGAMQKENR